MNLANDIQALYNILAPVTTTLKRSFEDASDDVVRDEEAIYVQRMSCEFSEYDGTDIREATYTYSVDIHVEKADPEPRALVILQSVLSALSGSLIGTIPVEVMSWERQDTSENTEALYSVEIKFTRAEVM